MARGYSGEISGWNVNRRRRSAAHHHLRRGDFALSLSKEAMERKLIQKPPFYTALKSMATSILGLAALRFKGKAEGLFYANPAPTWCFLGATFGYSLVMGSMEQIQSRNDNGIRFQVLNRAAFALGLASTVSLISIFNPHRFSFVPLIMLAPLLVVLAWPLLGPAYNCPYTSAFDSILAKVSCWARRSNFTRGASLPK